MLLNPYCTLHQRKVILCTNFYIEKNCILGISIVNCAFIRCPNLGVVNVLKGVTNNLSTNWDYFIVGIYCVPKVIFIYTYIVKRTKVKLLHS